MQPARSTWPFVLALTLTMAFIVYGSLYPFEFEFRPGGGALAALLSTWRFRLEHAGNLIGNVLFYAPLGFCAMLNAGDGRRWFAPLCGIALLGGALSISMELLQFYVGGRVSTLADVYPNVAGAVAGALCARVAIPWFSDRATTRFKRDPIALLLLVAFLGYRLFPYVPSLDLHEYWRAIKPIVRQPALHPYAVCRYAGLWLLVAAAGQALNHEARIRGLLPLALLAVLGAQMAIMNNALSLDELIGGPVAVVLWSGLSRVPARPRFAVVAGLVGLLVLAERLEPFGFTVAGHGFGWIPFRALLHGSMGVNAQSLLEKLFLYGGVLWLMHRAGLRLALGGPLLAGLLLATSAMETHLPGRSAETTDAVLALVIAGLFALLAPAPRNPPSPRRPRRAQQHHRTIGGTPAIRHAPGARHEI